MEKHREDDGPKFGWGRFTPKFLQVFNGPKFFVFSLSLLTILKTFASGYFSQSIPTIEKRFSMTSQALGVIAATNDIPGLILIGIVSYYGEHSNKIKWLGYGGLITGIGSLFSVLPHLIVGNYEPVVSNPSVSNTSGLCVPQSATNVTSGGCTTVFATEWYYMFIFIISQVLMGTGSMPLFSLGPAYIDENVQPKSVPIYIGIWFAATWLGPGLGFILGGYINTVYVDVTLPEGVNLNPLSPQWIGAWWLGFLVVGIMNIVFSLVMLGFPKELPGAREMREEAMKNGILAKRDKNINGKLKELVPATIGLLKNATYMFNTLALSAGILYIQGSSNFLAKLTHLKYAMDYQTIGTLLGSIFTPAGIFGIMLGGFICRFFNVKKSCKRAALMIFVVHCIFIWGGFVWKIPGCDDVPIVGVTTSYSNKTCFSDCGCTKAAINPVCGVDKNTYLSPCDAGCMSGDGVGGSASQCRCIATGVNTSGTITPGYCDRGSNCNNVVGFLFIIGVMSVLIALFSVPSRMVVLRCVPFNQRSYALGFQFVISKLLGFIPSPVMFGVVVDMSCILWSESCNQRGACLLYDIEKLSNSFLALVLACFGLATLFYFLSYWLYKPNNEEEQENEYKDEKKMEGNAVGPAVNYGYFNDNMANNTTFETGL